MEQNFFSIGEVSKICNVSRKALRYYDQIGLISPDYINEENGYRYYSEDTLLYVPVLKYYKQMGFKLEEMQGLFDDVNFAGIPQMVPGKNRGADRGEAQASGESDLDSGLVSVDSGGADGPALPDV